MTRSWTTVSSTGTHRRVTSYIANTSSGVVSSTTYSPGRVARNCPYGHRDGSPPSGEPCPARTHAVLSTTRSGAGRRSLATASGRPQARAPRPPADGLGRSRRSSSAMANVLYQCVTPQPTGAEDGWWPFHGVPAPHQSLRAAGVGARTRGGPAVLQGRLGVHQEARTAREPARRPADRGPGPAGRLVEAGSHHPGGTSLSRSSWPPPAATAPALHRKVSPSRRARTDNRRRRRSRWLPCRAWALYSPNAPDSNRWRWSTTCTTSSPATTSIRTPTGWRCSTNEDQPLAAWLGEHDTAGYRLSRKAGWDSFVNAAPRPRFEVLTRDLGLSYSPARYGLTPSRSTHGPVGGF